MGVRDPMLGTSPSLANNTALTQSGQWIVPCEPRDVTSLEAFWTILVTSSKAEPGAITVIHG